MGFFAALKRVLNHDSAVYKADETRKRIRDAWGLDEDEPPGQSHTAEGPGASAYDRSQWQKRLHRVLDDLPASQPQWHDLVTDAQALKLETEWIAECQRQEFAFLVRRAVSDRVVSEVEHQKLDLARELIGMSEAEAEGVLHAIMAEAEAFFGKPVKDEA
jgi:hypothetical protein